MTHNVILRYFIHKYRDAFVYLIENDYIDICS